MTGQNDRPDECLTGQALDQAGHCPLTGRYFEPFSVLNGFNFYFWWCDSDNREQYWNYEYMKTI